MKKRPPSAFLEFSMTFLMTRIAYPRVASRDRCSRPLSPKQLNNHRRGRGEQSIVIGQFLTAYYYIYCRRPSKCPALWLPHEIFLKSAADARVLAEYMRLNSFGMESTVYTHTYILFKDARDAAGVYICTICLQNVRYYCEAVSEEIESYLTQNCTQ